MVPVICIVGKPASGKTTLIEKIVRQLKTRGLKVTVIKHTSHDVPLDTPGKDTARAAAAGADAAVLVTDRGYAVFRPSSGAATVAHLAEQWLCDADIVIAEGFKSEPMPKIEVLSPGGERCGCNPEGLMAIAIPAGTQIDTGDDGLKVFDRDDAETIADFIDEKIIRAASRSDANVWVDGHAVELNPFVKAFVTQTVRGMLSALKGGKKPEKIRLKIGR